MPNILSKYKDVLLVLALSFVYILFRESFEGIITRNLVDNVFSKFNESGASDLICIILIEITVIVAIARIGDGFYPSKNGIFIYMIFLLFYCYYRISNKPWQFYESKNFAPHLYSDYFVFMAFNFVMYYKSKKPQLNEENKTTKKFFEDTHETFGSEDILRRNKFSKDLVSFIKEFVPKNKSFAIGIIGAYGSGKSVFLKMIENELSINAENVIVNFNPWLSKSPEKIVDDFFDALSGELANYSRSISRKIKSYSSKLTALNDHILFRITDSIVDKFIESDLSSQYDEINLSIKDLNKRLIIFIDDVDRLNRNEVFEVLRLIRNTANFANTFFIVAYDKEYVVESLKLSNIPSYNNYLEKIFQIEVPLPNYDKNILVNQFQILLLSYVQNEDEKNELRSAFNTLENYSEFRYDWLSIANIDKLMEKYLNNLRDVIRISNSFILLYHNLKGEVDLKELLVLEMIKSRFTVVYNLLASKKILNLKSENRENRFSVDVEVLNKYIAETKLYSIEDQELIIESVNFLYNRSQEFTMRSVTLPQNHFIYFSYQNFDHVPLVQFNKFRNGNLEDFLKQLDVWYKEGKKDLQNLFIETNEYNGKSDFEIMIKAMLYLSKYDIPNWDINLFKKVSSIDDIVIKYYKNDFDEYRNFLNLLFENAIYPYYGEVKLLYNFLYRIIKKDLFTNLFSKDDLQTKLLFYFRQVLTKKNKVDNEVFELYYSNLEDIVNSRIILNEHANELFREFIKQNWKSYLQLLPRRKYIGGNESVYVLEPFLKQTFGTYPNFKSFLYSLPDEDPCVQAIKIFFAEYERNNYESFKIQNEKIFDKCNPDALK